MTAYSDKKVCKCFSCTLSKRDRKPDKHAARQDAKHEVSRQLKDAN